MASAKSPRRLVGFLVALVVIAGLVAVFLRTVRSARSEPYAISGANAGPWTLSIEMASQPNEPVLLLRPPSALSTELFDQVFKRSMESMRAPETAGIPLVLYGELERAGSERISPDALLALARRAGLEATTPVPRCIAHRRQPEPDTRQQLFFAVFDDPAFDAFRKLLGERLGPSFDPGFVSPVLFVGVVESSLHKWLPLHVDAARDCVAPIAIAQK
jgi:hypothetical protein